jgi:hypothetical protein
MVDILEIAKYEFALTQNPIIQRQKAICDRIHLLLRRIRLCWKATGADGGIGKYTVK